ncbi:MAG: hypothetical protein ACKPKO_28450 [Candidatus Fonsibacter sp.]
MSSMNGMATETRSMKISVYKESGIMYIRYGGIIEERQHGQNNIGGARPAFSKMTEQVVYGDGSGKML